MLNKQFIKTVSIFSAVTGFILAVPSLIPNVFYITIILLMFFVAPFVIMQLRNFNPIKNEETEKYLITGAVSGITSFLGFSVVFFPVAFVLNLIFKTESFIWVKVVFSNFGYLVFMVVLMSLMSGLFNGFTALITSNLFKKQGEK